MRHQTASSQSQQRHAPTDMLEALLYELLDAHSDTARLAAELGLEAQGAIPGELSIALDRTTALRWSAHLDYLRALQRKGRETLAHSYGGLK